MIFTRYNSAVLEFEVPDLLGRACLSPSNSTLPLELSFPNACAPSSNLADFQGSLAALLEYFPKISRFLAKILGLFLAISAGFALCPCNLLSVNVF